VTPTGGARAAASSLTSQGQIDFYPDPRLIGPAADGIADLFRTTPN
jgi:hypothetical protein